MTTNTYKKDKVSFCMFISFHKGSYTWFQKIFYGILLFFSCTTKFSIFLGFLKKNADIINMMLIFRTTAQKGKEGKKG